MSFIKYTVAFVMIALFSICIITFAVNFGIDNDAAVNLNQDGDFTTLNANASSEVQSFYAGSSTAYDAYQSSTISSQTDSSEGGTQFKVTPASSLGMAKTALSAAWEKIFGRGSGFGIILTAIIGLLTFIIGLYAWKAWKGDPD